jgi:hypothetical protein
VQPSERKYHYIRLDRIAIGKTGKEGNKIIFWRYWKELKNCVGFEDDVILKETQRSHLAFCQLRIRAETLPPRASSVTLVQASLVST